MLSLGADPNLRSSVGGETALIVAAENGHHQVVKELVKGIKHTYIFDSINHVYVSSSIINAHASLNTYSTYMYTPGMKSIPGLQLDRKLWGVRISKMV